MENGEGGGGRGGRKLRGNNRAPTKKKKRTRRRVAGKKEKKKTKLSIGGGKGNKFRPHCRDLAHPCIPCFFPLPPLLILLDLLFFVAAAAAWANLQIAPLLPPSPPSFLLDDPVSPDRVKKKKTNEAVW